jgi:hypothetical protein
MCYEIEKYFDTPEMWCLYEDSLREKEESKRDKIISLISNFDFDRFRSDSEWISLFIDDFDYPRFNKKSNSVEVSLIYTSCREGILEDQFFTLEVFVYGKTIITTTGKAPSLAFSVSKAIVDDYLGQTRPAIKNKSERNKAKNRRVKRVRAYGLLPVAV